MRIQALYKRSHSKSGEVLTVGDLTMDRRTLEVTRSGQNILLNAACLKILERLMEVSPAVLVRADLETLLWGDDKPESSALRSHFYKLRQAIDRQFGRQLIHTLHRIGYRSEELNDEKSK